MDKRQEDKLMILVSKLINKHVDKMKDRERDKKRKDKKETHPQVQGLIDRVSTTMDDLHDLKDTARDFAKEFANFNVNIDQAKEKFGSVGAVLMNGMHISSLVIHTMPFLFLLNSLCKAVNSAIRKEYKNLAKQLLFIGAVVGVYEFMGTGLLKNFKKNINWWIVILNRWILPDHLKVVTDDIIDNKGQTPWEKGFFVGMAKMHVPDNSHLHHFDETGNYEVEYDNERSHAGDIEFAGALKSYQESSRSNKTFPKDWSASNSATSTPERASAYSEDVPLTQGPGDCNVIVNDLAGFLSTTIIGYIINKSPVELKAKKLVEGISAFPRAKTGTIEMLTWLMEVVSRCLNYIDENVLALPLSVQLEQLEPEFDNWAASVLQLQQRNKESPFKINSVNYDIIHNVLMRGYKMQLTHKKTFESARVRNTMNSLTNVLRNTLKPFEQANINGSGPRMEPVTIMLRGETGVGKSYILFPLVTTILKNILPAQCREDFSERPNDYIYMRNPEHKFWDGYRGQFATLMDEFGQVRDSVGREESEFMDLIRASNMFPYVLHMASLEDKGNTMFNSKLIVCSSNMTSSTQINSIVKPGAVARRFHCNYLLTPKQDYCTFETRNAPYRQRKLDPSHPHLYAGQFNFKMYEFHQLNINDERTGVILTYEGLVKEIVKIYKQKEEASELYIANLNAMDVPIVDMETEDTVLTQSGSKKPITRANIFGSGLKKDKVGAVVEHLITQYFPHMFFLHVRTSIIVKLLIKLELVDAKTLDLISSKEDVELLLKTLYVMWHNENGFGVIENGKFDEFCQSFFSIPSKDMFFMNEQLIEVEKQYAEFVKLNTTSSYVDSFKKYIGLTRKKMLDTVHNLPNYSTLKFLVPVIAVAGGIYAFYARDDATEDIDYMRTGNVQTAEQIDDTALPWGNGVKVTQDKNLEEAITQFASGQNSKGKSKIFVRSARSNRFRGGQEIPHTQSGIDHNCDSMIAAVVHSNYYEMTLHHDKRIGAGTFITGRYFMVNKHYLEFFRDELSKNEYHGLVLYNLLSQKKIEVGLAHVLHPSNYYELPDNDMCIIRFPKNTPMHKDIIKYFVTEAQLIRINGFNCKMFSLYGNVVNTFMVEAKNIKDTTIMHQKDNGETVHYMLSRGFDYWGYTGAGSCGALLTVYNSAMGPGKFVGFHTAGLYSGRGMACAVSCDTILEVLSKFEQQAVTQSGSSKQVILAQDWIRDVNPKTQITLKEFFPQLGTIDRTLLPPSYTSIIQSDLYGKWGLALTRPVNTGFVHKDGLYINVKEQALIEYAGRDVLLDENKIHQVFHCVFQDLDRNSFSRNQDKFKPRVYSYQDSILGIPEYGVSSINRQTSCGFPWCFVKDQSMKGKTFWFGNETDFCLDNVNFQQLFETLKLQEEQLRSGVRPYYFFVDTPKDERRSNEKVDQGKIRMFSAAPLDYTIMFRRYFLSFMIYLQENKISNGCAVGINVYSDDWNFLAKQITSKSDHIFAGDFSKFDKRQSAQVLSAMVKYINEWYDDEHSLVREMLWKEVYNSKHIFTNMLYEWTHALPSGHPMTVFINSLYNLFIIRYSYCAMHPEGFIEGLHTFSKEVTPIVYGDDNIIGVKQRTAEWFNQCTITPTIKASFNLDYTDETKEQKITRAYRQIEEISFLKRTFHFDKQYKKYIAPLDLRVVLEIPYWTKRGLDKHEITRTNFENTLGEISLHGPEVYTYWSRVLLKAATESRVPIPYLIDYSSVLHKTLGREEYW